MLRYLVLSLCVAACAFSQTGGVDKSGNVLLSGSYNFRHVVWIVSDSAGNLNNAQSMYGTIRFDGAGRYTLSGQIYKAGSAAATTITPSISGSYSITASGYGYMDSPLQNGGLVYGLVSNGIFIGSSTEDAINDFFVAAPQASLGAGAFNGNYALSEIDFSSGLISSARSSLIKMQPNGGGGLGTVTVSSYTGPSGKEAITTLTSATYTLSSGVGTINYGTSAAPNTRSLYLAPDSNFIFGGSPLGFDFYVGVKVAAGNGPIEAVSGLYYQAGVSVDVSALGTAGSSDWESYYGAVSYQRGVVREDLTAVVPVGHKRQLNGVDNDAVDYTYSDQYSPNADGTFFYFSEHRIPSIDGNLLIASGFSQFLGLEIAIKAPVFTGSGVFMNPAGIVNAASSAPFTAGLSRGEFLTIYGSNLAPKLDISTDFPRTLSGVQVLINNRPAPLYFVSPTQISLVVPYSTTELAATVQVINNGTPSNSTTMFVSSTATPGVFTKPYPGFGQAAALHPDYTEVTQQNPARPGETIAIFMAGLGDVSPAITEGDLSPASTTTSTFTAYIDGLSATVAYAGLAPQLRGLYQLNVTIPATVTSGDKYVDVVTVGAIHSQAQVWISTSAAGKSEAPAPEAQVQRLPRGAARMRREPGGARLRPAIPFEK